jgi:hypothetical protein
MVFAAWCDREYGFVYDAACSARGSMQRRGLWLACGYAAGGSEHYKDTAIAMFTLVRQCELSQNWSLLRELEPKVLSAIQFLDSLRSRARSEGSSLGRYGLLPKGFADGGFDGSRDELTNTLWTMAGLKAIGAAGEQQKIPKVAYATQLYRELYSAFYKPKIVAPPAVEMTV